MFIKGKKSPRLDVHHGKDSARVSGVILPSGHLGFFFFLKWFGFYMRRESLIFILSDALFFLLRDILWL